ncbi:MAG: hypothetical protein K2N05_03835 [Muribaculaceae bacterium]|nr:hypothetical protein [Muribaculaceae bacterium]
MKKIHLILYLVIFLLIFWSCSTEKKQISSDLLIGNWTSPFNTENISGYDTLFFLNEGKLIMRQGIYYSGSDSGFDFRAKANTKIEGKWRLVQDTLSIMYYQSSLDVAWSFTDSSINYSNSDSIRIIPLNQKKLMFDDLIGVLDSNYRDQYNGLDSTYVVLGIIEKVTSHQLELTNKGNKITLIKVL